ncbi:hypothetical protein MNBD_UNCLBAC01-1531 [hydrothermal vent metagenome]|uniref:DUF2304 domain-containing protein n=1 Tax=hydrothermal vent metagenome TaxID=652676 RepID=A0A3B1D2D4_9ZZZZ
MGLGGDLMTTKILAISIALFILIFIIELVRRERLTFKYAFGWIFVSVLALFFSCFDGVLFGLASFLGFALPSNFIFFALLSVFVFLSLLMTIFLCQQNSRNDIMAQKISMLQFEVEQLKGKNIKDE